MGSTKMDRMCSILNNIPVGDKAVVFCEYTLQIDIITIYLNFLEIDFAVYDGRMDQPKKDAAIMSFTMQPSIQVFVCNSTCASFALNLQMANHVIIMQPDFTPTKDLQAIHRCEIASLSLISYLYPLPCLFFLVFQAIAGGRPRRSRSTGS